MQELSATNLARKPNLTGGASEAMVLGSLTQLINSGDLSPDDGPSPFQVPPSEVPAASDLVQRRRPVPSANPLIAPAPLPPAPVMDAALPPEAPVTALPQFIFTTGRMKAGKDYVLAALGYPKIGLADPLYALQKHFFGTDDKSQAGARAFLQTVGQWGRGLVNAQYPLSVTRAMFTTMIRTMAKSLPFADSVQWSKFGTDDKLWIDALLHRMGTMQGPLAVSNCRFENEFNAFQTAGMIHFHVMCSAETWKKRLAEVKLTPASKEVIDTSEQMAAFLDNDVLKRIKLKPVGPKLRVIWNDPGIKPPSPRLYTLAELLPSSPVTGLSAETEV